MSVDGIRAGLRALPNPDGSIDLKKLDQLLLDARDGGGIDAAERKELISASDSFSDDAKQLLMKTLSAVDQKNAFVNVETRAPMRDVDGRFATLSTDIKGLNVKLGLFDNDFAVSGKAKSDGKLQLTIEGQDISVDVKKGEKPAEILQAIQKQLPSGVTGLVLSGDVQPYEMESYKGATATKKDKAAHLALYKPDALGLKPGEKPLRVVVTGYGKFMGITDNPSANMAQKLSEAGVKGAIVEYRRLDVTQGAVDAFMNEMKKNPPDVILSMGVAPASQVEELPENKVDAAEDGDGKMMTAGEVRPGGKPVLKTDLPVQVIDDSLKKFGDKREVGTSLSDPNYQPDRSAYLCNYLGYNLASAFGQTDATTAGFMHVTDHTPPEQMQSVLEAIVARQLDWRRTNEWQNNQKVA
jgi:pyrrolidone-carboxylate peptidase